MACTFPHAYENVRKGTKTGLLPYNSEALELSGDNFLCFFYPIVAGTRLPRKPANPDKL